MESYGILYFIHISILWNVQKVGGLSSNVTSKIMISNRTIFPVTANEKALTVGNGINFFRKVTKI